MSENYYEELGVEPGASRDEIREAHQARVADLESAREKKGVTDSQLQQNREAVARVRKAWNVLSDPYQRGRYDQKIAAPVSADSGVEGGVELADVDEPSERPGVELTGWRKFMAPPPPKQTGAKNGKEPASSRRPRPEPTIALPGGMQLAESRNRGMAMLFDIAVILIVYTGVSFLLPGLVQSDYKSITTQIDKVNNLHDARTSIDDAQSSLKSAKTTAATASANKDLKSAQQAFTKAQTAAKKAGASVAPESASSLQKPSDQPTAKALQKQADNLAEKIKGTQIISTVVVLLLALLYLVPVSVRTGRTFGMRNRKIRIVRVDGSPLTWTASVLRFGVPLAVALLGLIYVGTLAPLIGLAIVGWCFFDRNRQGFHDKLAKTVIVDA
jgi:curved DNA-binding protein CbpA